MVKTSFEALVAARQDRAAQISALEASISNNAEKAKDLTEDKIAALRSKKQSAANTAQFGIDALEVENTDLRGKIESLRATRIPREAFDAAWAADVEQGPERLGELTLYRTVAELYDAVCVRARNRYAEWAKFALELEFMAKAEGINGAFYAAPSPENQLQTVGYDFAFPELFHGDRCHGHSFSPDGVDKLIELLQNVKANGVDSIF